MITQSTGGAGGAAPGVAAPSCQVTDTFSEVSSEPVRPLPPAWVSAPSAKSTRWKESPEAWEPPEMTSCSAIAVSAR